MAFNRGRSRNLIIGVPREAFRPSGVFLGLVALTAAGGVMAWFKFGSIPFDVILFVIAGYLVSLCLHEYAHAFFAYRAGDIGVVERGYLTLNPLKYTNPLLSIIMPVLILLAGGFGLPGGAVWVDHSHIRNRVHESLISAAGPLTNVIFAGALITPFAIGVDVVAHVEFWAAVAFLAYLQVTASLLNFVPIPGVDGGNMIRPWLPWKYQRTFNLIAPFGMIVLFLLLFNRIGSGVFFNVVDSICNLVGLPTWLSSYGFGIVQFWK
jgi:Zn-dependent protease